MAILNWELRQAPCGIYVDCNLLLESSTDGINYTTLLSATSDGSGTLTLPSDLHIRATMWASDPWPTTNCKMVFENQRDPDPRCWGWVAFTSPDERMLDYNTKYETVINIRIYSVYHP